VVVRSGGVHLGAVHGFGLFGQGVGRVAFAWINLCAVPVFVTAGIWERLVWDAFQCWRQNKAGVGCVRQREVGFTLRSSEAVP